MANPLFPYKALDSSRQEIRLLRLQPAAGLLNDISCEIVHVYLCSAPKYETISYVWGEPVFPECILLEGQPFNVTTNLFHALQHLRLAELPRTLWIDAICIDQSNNVERGQQVAFMGDIYTAGVINTAWLGIGTDQSDVAFDLVIEMNEKYHLDCIATPEHAKEMNETEGSILSHNVFNALANISIETWVAIDDAFAQRTLWNRVWVVQEIALAKKVLLRCGTKEIEWEQLQRFWRVVVFWYKKVLKIPTSSPATMTMLPTSFLHDQRMCVAAKSSDKDTPLVELWYIFHRWNATDPRDKIFALLGLANKASIVPDYSSSVSTVFAEMTRKTICQARNLDILCMGYRPRKEGLLSLPS